MLSHCCAANCSQYSRRAVCFRHLRKAAQRLCNKVGISSSKITKLATKHLAYNNPSMALVREWVQMMITTRQIDGRLLCHFDQVWTTHWEPSKCTLFKDTAKAGQMAPNRSKPSQREMLTKIKSALNITENANSGAIVEKEKGGIKQAALGPASTLVPVEGGRVARTTTTLSWADGSMGTAYVTHSQYSTVGDQPGVQSR